MPSYELRSISMHILLLGLLFLASCGGDASFSIPARPTVTPLRTEAMPTMTPTNAAPTTMPTTAAPTQPAATSTSTPVAPDTATPAPTNSATQLATSTIASNTATPIATHTQPAAPSDTPTQTATNTPPPSATATPTLSATNTPVATATLTAIPSPTDTSIPTATPTPADTATPAPSSTANPPPADTATPSHTASVAPSSTPSPTSPPLETATPVASPTGGLGAVCGNGILEPGEFVDDPVNGLIGDLEGVACPADTQIFACAAAGSFTFDVILEPPLGTDPNSITAVIGYRSDRASIPGSGTAGLARVTFPSPQPFVRSARDFDYAIRVVGIRTGSFPEGPAFSIRFDGCTGQPDPNPLDMACTIEGCAGSGGSIVGCECSIVAR